MAQKIKFTTPPYLSLGAPGIGTRVSDVPEFLAAAAAAVEAYDWSTARQEGQGFIPCPAGIPYVSAGCGPRSSDPDDYVARAHRGRVELYLRRDCAAQTESLNLVVYTREAYNVDPQVVTDGRQVYDETVTHVIVAVLASAGPKPPLGVYRFVSNLAGGNKEATLWSGDEIRSKSAEIVAYDAQWVTVAD